MLLLVLELVFQAATVPLLKDAAMIELLTELILRSLKPYRKLPNVEYIMILKNAYKVSKIQSYRRISYGILPRHLSSLDAID